MAISLANCPVIQLRLIGQMLAGTIGGEVICPPERQTCALLAILAMSVPRPVPRASLIGLLWSRLPAAAAQAALRSEVSRLSNVLGPVGKDLLDVTRFSLSLRPGAAWIDAQDVMHVSMIRQSDVFSAFSDHGI